jgi:Pyridine nucleotide-disulphide oxidoreductase
MNRSFRRNSIGLLSGAIASTALTATLHYGPWSLLLGSAIGVAYSAAVRPTRRAYADNLMAGGSLGVPLWCLISVIAVPLLSGQMPEWSAEQMRHHFPALVGWVVFGAFLGITNQASQDVAEYLLGPEPAPKAPAVSVSKRIVILGGGFAGMSTAECLEEKLRRDSSISLTLLNETNALLFTPMLAEVAGSSLEPSHISTPLRSTLRQTDFIRGVVADVDLEKRLVILRHDSGVHEASSRRGVPYDQLVFALGSISNYLGMTNIEKFAFDFKSLLDAVRIRNHIIEMFERADVESVRIEPVLGLILGASGGLLESVVLKTSLFSGGLLGITFGLAFGLFFARRATSPGSGLIWGLGSSFLLWLLAPGGFLNFAVSVRNPALMLQDAQGHFSELVSYVLCLGMPVGVGLGIRGALRTSRLKASFAWGRAIVAGGFAGTLGGRIFGRWVSSGDYFPLLAGFGELGSRGMTIFMHFAIALLIGVAFGLLFQQDVRSYGSCMGWGLGFGIFWWFLGPMTLLRLASGKPLDWSAEQGSAVFGSLVGHILYGLILGVAYATIDKI